MRIEQINLGSVDHVAEVGLYDVGEVPGHQDHRPQKKKKKFLFVARIIGHKKKLSNLSNIVAMNF